MISTSQRQLRALLMVADELHVGRAAERLGVTQPSLSRQIAAIEKDLGVPLFSRARRRFVLTPAGEIVVAGAREILRRSDEVVRDAKRAHAGEVGSLRLGFVESATYEAIPRLVSAFRAACPDVVVNARTMTTLEQSEALRTGHLDVGLLRPVIALHGLTKKVISRDALVAALPATHRLAGYERIPLAALADESFVFYIRDSGPVVHDTIIGYCLAAGFSPRIVQEAPGADHPRARRRRPGRLASHLSDTTARCEAGGLPPDPGRPSTMGHGSGLVGEQPVADLGQIPCRRRGCLVTWRQTTAAGLGIAPPPAPSASFLVTAVNHSRRAHIGPCHKV